MAICGDNNYSESIFTKNKETEKLLSVMEIYTDELNDYIKSSTEKG